MALEAMDLKTKRPLIIFANGGLARILLEEVFKDEDTGQDFIKVYLVPTRDTMAQYGIDKNQLLTQPMIAGYDGYMIRRYPLSSIVRISSNPANPMVLCLCDFNGIETSKTSGNLEFIKTVMDENEALKLETSRLRAGMDSQYKEFLQALAMSEEYRKRYLEQFKITADLEKVLGAFAKATKRSGGETS